MIREKELESARKRRRATYLHLKGTIGNTAPDAQQALEASTSSRLLIVDLREAETIDSHGLAWLESLGALAEARDVRVRIVAPENGRIRRILTLMRFDRFFVLASSAFEALHFGRGS